ncbi:MAG: hypothetical protein PHD43_22180 [Methylococcales bacterium]|nr:hypothetical protein [Methylococcales bacterium]
MSTLTNYQTIPGNGGKPALVVIPFADFIKLPGAVTPARFPMQWLEGALWMRPIRWKVGVLRICSLKSVRLYLKHFR